MKVAEFLQPKAFKFETKGDTLDGLVSRPPAAMPDKFNAGKTMLSLMLDTADNEWWLPARGQLLDAIVEAVRAAGVDEIDQGGALRVEYIDDRLLRNGYTMKIYRAEYVPPPSMGVGVLGDAEVWGPQPKQAAE
jgi:hypothetical protein